MKLSIIIVSYNVRHYLWQCLDSVFRAQGSWEMEVFVVDNASCDGTIDFLRPHFPQVHYIQNTENVGFSRANNQAIRLSQGEYVLLLNPDTLVTEHTLTDCVHFLDTHPEAGATGVAMHNADGRFAWESRRGLPTPWTSFCKMSGLGTLFPQSRTFGHYHLRYLPIGEAARIEIISGAFNMLRRKALDEVGLLDERFFMYGEDIDLSYRVMLGGWQNWYLPTPILHYKGESTQKNSFRYVYNFYEAMLLFFDKHYGERNRLFCMVIRWAVRSRAAIDMLIRVWKHFRRRICPKRQEEDPICMDDYLTFDPRTDSYAQMIERMVASNHRRLIAVRHTPISTLILPNDLLPL